LRIVPINRDLLMTTKRKINNRPNCNNHCVSRINIYNNIPKMALVLRWINYCIVCFITVCHGLTFIITFQRWH